MPLPYIYGSAEFRINTFAQGADNTGFTITQLAGGGFVALWTASFTNGDVKARIFDDDGNPAGGDLTLWEGPGIQRARDVLGTPDGGFVVAFNGNLGLSLQRYTASGAKVGPLIAVDGSASSSAELHATPGDSFTIVWAVASEGIRIQRYESDGALGGAVFELLAADPAHVPVNPTYAPLAGGGFAIGYAITGELIFDVYDGSGVLVATYDDFGIDADEIEVTPLEGGGFVMLYEDEGTISLQMFDEDFAPDGDPIFVAGLPGFTNMDAGAVSALPGGGFIAIWQNGFGPSSDNGFVDGGVEAQIFDASGAALGARFRLNDPDTISNTLPEVAVLANGDIAVIWREVPPNQGSNGNIQARILIPGTALPVIDGTGASETVNGTAASEVLNGLGGDDILRGGDGNDDMFGGEGSDYIVGIYNDSGFDELHGGNGDDFLLVDYYDRVYEAVGGGFDNVCAIGDYFLALGAEIEVLSTLNTAGGSDIRLRGNEFGQVIMGNAGANTLDGGGGVDWMDGFGNSDTYYTDGDDIIVEAIGGSGSDTVIATSSLQRLGAGSEIERLRTDAQSGTRMVDLIGNEFNQEIFGNNGQNGLDGGGGADILHGFGGNDFYYVDSDDVIRDDFASQGFDNVLARSNFTLSSATDSVIEVLSTANHSGTTAINLTGNQFAQVVIGNAGANMLDGGGGIDRLAGLGGVDSFAFTTALGANNIDRIADFDADDTIVLENSVFVGLATGALDANAFVLGTAAADADDRIVYDAATGRLFFDADGNGSGDLLHFATLEGAPTLTASDFTVI